MSKVDMIVTIPDGYEIAEGEQPRKPKRGDLFLNLDKKVILASVTHSSHYIILKKKKPEYHMILVDPDALKFKWGNPGITSHRNRKKFVDAKAIQDLLGIVDELMSRNLIAPDVIALEPFRELASNEG